MFGPGEYVPDPTEGIVDIKDLPRPQLVAYSRNHEHTPCPRCDHRAYRHKCGQRTLHDLGDLSAGCPVDFPIGGFSPPAGRLARGCKPPAFSRFLFQSAVKSAESF
jgi:hypothetical protein